MNEIDRRPIKTRDAKFAGVAAAWLVSRGVSANKISVLGMCAGILAGCALASTSRWPDRARPTFVVAAVLVQLRLLANMLDGMVAVSSGTTSPSGELYNEIPDRVSDTAILVGLGYAMGGDPVLGWAAAICAMFTAYIRAVGKAAGSRQEFCGPLAKPQRMFLTSLLALWCGFAPDSWQPVFKEFPWGLPACLLLLIVIGTLWTSLRRLSRIAGQLRSGGQA